MEKERYKTVVKVSRPILTLFEFAISVFLIAATAQITLGNSLKSYLITGISIVLGVTTYLIWYTDGIERGESTTKVFNTSLRFHTYARTITNMQVVEQLKEFCKKKNEDYAKELVLAKLAEYTLSLKELEEYTEKLKNARLEAKTKPRIKIGALCIGKVIDYGDDFNTYIKQFDKDQLKALNFLSSKTIYFKKLVPKDLTESGKARKGIKPENLEHKDLPFTLISKIVWGIALGVLTAYIVFTRNDAWTTNETIQVLMWAFSISYNVYTSVRAGYKAVTVDRYNYFKDKNELCVDFFGFIGKSVDDIEKESKLQEQLKS